VLDFYQVCSSQQAASRLKSLIAPETTAWRDGFGGAKAQSGGVLDHLVVLLADERPIDWTRQDGLEVRIRIGLGLCRANTTSGRGWP
jgi:hypothetical protein